jgi:TolB-like protein/DNA-binding winged helix-turn-helix (wHTH) protein
MNKAGKHFYEFGQFRLDRGERLLWRGPERVELPPRVFDTLVVLVESEGRLLEKDELMARVWPDAAVEENNLTQAIYLLRKTLQDGESGARYIETVPKRGYRFVIAVRNVVRDSGATSIAVTDEAKSAGMARNAVEVNGEIEDGDTSEKSGSLAKDASGRVDAPPSESDSVEETGRGVWLAKAAILAIAVLAVLMATPLRQRILNWRGAPKRHSLAVLPLQNLSNDPGQDYFADGFTEELVTDIAQIRALRVVSRTSTMTYKGTKKPLPQIARELNADLVLEGSVIRDGNRVRVTAQLINAPSDTHLWAQTYESSVNDVLDIQSQISRAIADDIRLDLSPEEKARLATVPTVDAEAHDLYLRASAQFAAQTADSIRQSLLLYQQAVEKDPNFAVAYVGIAQAEAALGQITAANPGDMIEQEKIALNKALEINPHLGDAHGMLASIAYYHDWDWPRAEREFRAALAEGARAPTEQRYGSALATQGRFAEGEAHLQIAMELDPLGKSPRVNQIFALYFQRRYGDARKTIEDGMAAGGDWLAGHGLMGLVAATERDCKESEKQAEWIQQKYPSALADFELSMANACKGDQAEARHYLDLAAAYKGPAFVSPYQLALGYAYAGDKETAMNYLDKSADIHEPQILYLKVDPLFDGIRNDARYVELERRVGLVK